MTTALKLICSLAVATAVSLVPFSSNAEEPGNDAGLSKTVRVWDLDLASAADVQTLYDRVREAAADVCRAEERRYWKDTRRPAPLGFNESCIAGAVDAAVRNVGNRRLAALHMGGTRRLL